MIKVFNVSKSTIIFKTNMVITKRKVSKTEKFIAINKYYKKLFQEY